MLIIVSPSAGEVFTCVWKALCALSTRLRCEFSSAQPYLYGSEQLNALIVHGSKTNLCLFLSQARAGIISTVEVLKVMEAFVNEPNYTVWSDLSCNLEILSTLLSHTDFYEEIQVFVKDVFSPIGERLGWDPKPGEGRRTHRWVSQCGFGF